MRFVNLSLIAAIAVVGGCTGAGTNDKLVYTPISGTTTLTATVTDSTAAPSSVTFTVDGAQVQGSVTQSGSQFSVQYDTTQVANGIHFVKALGAPDSTVLLNASIFVNNTGTPAASGAAAASTGATP